MAQHGTNLEVIAVLLEGGHVELQSSHGSFGAIALAVCSRQAQSQIRYVLPLLAVCLGEALVLLLKVLHKPLQLLALLHQLPHRALEAVLLQSQRDGQKAIS